MGRPEQSSWQPNQPGGNPESQRRNEHVYVPPLAPSDSVNNSRRRPINDKVRLFNHRLSRLAHVSSQVEQSTDLKTPFLSDP